MAGTKILFCGAIALALIAVASAAEDSLSIIDQMTESEEVAHRLKMAIKAAKQMENGILQETVRTNFLASLYSMANASAIVGADASRAAGTVIRGLVQDSFNFGSLGAYLPRLIFLDGPTQFIEMLRLVRTNQIRIPMDVDGAIDTLINFAAHARDSGIGGNARNFLMFFPNIFRGAELLAGDVLYSVFAWLAPISPADISLASINQLHNRWDVKSSTTSRSRVAEE